MGPLGELGALFNPGMRHEIEERQAKANRREEEGNARDGDLRIDLASGVAVINMSKSGDQPAGPTDGSARRRTSTAAAERSTEDVSSSGDGPAAEQAGLNSEPSSQDRSGSAASPDHARSAQHPQSPDHPGADVEVDPSAATRGGRPLTAAQARRLATAARRSADGDRPARPATPRPANAQLPSSKASRAAR